MNIQKHFAVACFSILLATCLVASLSAQLHTGSEHPRDPTAVLPWQTVDHVSGPPRFWPANLTQQAQSSSISGSVMNWSVTVKNIGPNARNVTITTSSNATIVSGGGTPYLAVNGTHVVTGTAPVDNGSGTVSVTLKTQNNHYYRTRTQTWNWDAYVNPDPVVTPMPAVVLSGSNGVAGASIVAPPNSLLASFGASTVFSRSGPTGNSCSSCGNGASTLLSNENLLGISHKFIPSNQASIGNCSPGVYFNFDYRVEFYQDYDGKNLAILFDPESERVFLLRIPIVFIQLCLQDRYQRNDPGFRGVLWGHYA